MSLDIKNFVTWIRTFLDDIYELKGQGGGGLDIDDVYPIGAIYLSVSSDDPNNLFPGTQWRMLTNTFLYASANPINQSSTTATLGESSHSLTEAEMPRHTHIQDSHNHTQNEHNHTQNEHNHTQNQHRHSLGSDWSSGSGSQGAFAYASNHSRTTKYTAYETPTNKATTATNKPTIATNQSATATNKYTGGSSVSGETATNGTAHNNMPPYLPVNMWKRIA